MVVEICPRCQQRYSRNSYDRDYEHKCNSKSSVLNNELVKKIGDYEDEATGEIIRVPNALLQGSPNRLQNTRAGIEGGRFSTLLVTKDDVEPKSTHRERQHFEHIEFGGNS